MPVAGSTQGTPSTSIDGYDLATQVCFAPLGPSAINPEGAAKAMADLQAQYIAATAAVGAAGANPNFVGNTLELGYPYNPNFRTARSYQMNIGIQRELTKGGVLTVDYLRNIGLHFQVGVDVNHAGDSRYLEMNAALNAIGTTVAIANGAPACSRRASVTQANASATWPAIIANNSSASINDFANNGLDSGYVYYGGYSAPYYGLTADTGAAFGGINPNVGSMFMNYPMGRSVYNGLQSEWRQRVKQSVPRREQSRSSGQLHSVPLRKRWRQRPALHSRTHGTSATPPPSWAPRRRIAPTSSNLAPPSNSLTTVRASA